MAVDGFGVAFVPEGGTPHETAGDKLKMHVNKQCRGQLLSFRMKIMKTFTF
jgi:hypothetical protein